MKLYGHVNRLSINTLKVRVALAEAGASVEYVAVDLTKGEQRRPEFLALNPHGKIPVLVDDDFVLAESDAILWYVAERFPAARLLGETPRQRARTLQWCDFTSTGVYPAYYDVYVHGVVNPPERRIHAVAESGRERLTRALKVLERVLATRATLAGEFSIADISLATVMRAIDERIPHDRSLYPHTRNWYQRVTERPAWRQAISSAAK